MPRDGGKVNFMVHVQQGAMKRVPPYVRQIGFIDSRLYNLSRLTWGIGGLHVPLSLQLYVPCFWEVRTSVFSTSPIRSGSKTTSTRKS